MKTNNMNNLFQLSHQNISKDKLIPLILFHDKLHMSKISAAKPQTLNPLFSPYLHDKTTRNNQHRNLRAH